MISANNDKKAEAKDNGDYTAAGTNKTKSKDDHLAARLGKAAMEQEKSFSFHFAHMVVHGFLHLLGFDHQNDRDEKNMQEIENQVLEKISILQLVR